MENSLSITNEAGLRSYFEEIFKLHQSGEAFPSSLDEVWPLVYSRKDKAVEQLKQYFIDGVDYQVFPEKGENSKAGRPMDAYKLSAACVEFFIARKVKSVFEIYRTVFHQKVAVAIAPMNPLEYLQLMLDGMKAQDTRLKTVEDEVKQLVAQTKTTPEYYTIVGYASLHGIPIGLKLAANLGRKASSICRMRNYPTEEIPDPRFGNVKTYPYSVLEEVFNLNISE